MDVDQEAQPSPLPPSSTPSRLSLAALLSPSQSPRPSATPDRANDRNGDRSASGSTGVNGHNGRTNGFDKNTRVNDDGDSDAEMLDASQADQSTTSRVIPPRRAKESAKDGAAERAPNGNATGEAVGEEEVEDEEEEDEDFDEDNDDDDDDDDDDDEDDDEEDDDEDDVDSSDEGDSVAEGATAAEGKAADSQTGDQNGTAIAATRSRSEDGKSAAGGESNGVDDDDRDSMMEELAGESGAKEGVAATQVQDVGTAKGIPKKKHLKRRSPSVDPSLPVGPPPRPTVRLRVKLSLNDEDNYLTNVPDEVYKALKLKSPDDAWAKWYESTMPVTAEAGDEERGEMPDTSDLGGLARLLEKYPSGLGAGKKKSNGKAKKKDKNMDYEIGEYDTRDPFVDDSELNVDEPTYSAKPSADGFFVSEGEVQIQEIERDKLEANREDMLTLATKRGQMPAGFGQTDKETGAGGAGALFLELGATVDNVTLINVMLSQHAVEFGIMTMNEHDQDRQNVTESARDGPAADSSNAPDDDSRHERRGSRSSPIAVDSDDAKEAANDRDDRMPPFEPIQPVKYAVEPVPKRLMQELIILRQMAAKESWLKKSKFPPNLREPTLKAITVALGLNELNENFFHWLPQIYPYNLFTVRKFVRRQFYEHHIGYMDKLMAMNETGMKKQIDGLYVKLKKEYDDAMSAWQARGSREGSPADGNATAGTAPAAVEDAVGGGEGGEEGDEDGGGAPVNKNAKPVKRWHWTEQLREALFTIMTIDNAKADLLSEKQTMEGIKEKLSVINARKVIYKRLLELWPEPGWTTTTALSNQYGLYKRRVEKFAQMLHEGKDGVSGGASGVVLY